MRVTAVRKGISLPTLQRLLGHDRLTTTEIYLSLSPA
jgi:site-specific recombinase XerD